MDVFIRHFQSPPPTATQFGGYAGQPCHEAGEYRGDCIHNHRRRFEKGQLFPGCPWGVIQGCGSESPHGLYWQRVGKCMNKGRRN